MNWKFAFEAVRSVAGDDGQTPAESGLEPVGVVEVE